MGSRGRWLHPSDHRTPRVSRRTTFFPPLLAAFSFPRLILFWVFLYFLFRFPNRILFPFSLVFIAFLLSKTKFVLLLSPKLILFSLSLAFISLPDGRSYIDCVGTRRFRVVDKWEQDGYLCGKIEYFDDQPLDTEEKVQRRMRLEQIHSEQLFLL